ncbi:MAG: energy transducer TonB [Bacteroidales bacterium]|nr:energy transducer TonB [Bacteroidales bacterium]MCK4407232.1 energy transducer TonB [Bacteroidales bacterium]
MDAKKSPKADLESKKVMFTQIGLIITLAIVLVAFNWKSYEKREIDLTQREIVEIPEEIIPITEQKVKPPPPPPPKQVTVINIVDDDVEIEDEIEIDAEADQDTEIEEYIPIEVDDDEEVEEAQIFTVVESMPSFPGGDKARIRFLNENIAYPTMARESGIQGRVYVTFVVERNGIVTDVKILRGIGGGCDEEAIRVVKAMPKWIPGKQRGKPVRVQFTLPIKFTLQ